MYIAMDTKEYDRKMKELQKIIKSKAWKQECADFAVELIKKRTKSGYGVKEQGGNKEKLKPLSASYKKFRKANPPTGDGATPTKSNLTYTGAMLDSITAKLTSKGIHLDLLNNTERYKAMWNSEKGRDFMFLSAAEQKQLQQFMKQRLLDEFNKIK